MHSNRYIIYNGGEAEEAEALAKRTQHHGVGERKPQYLALSSLRRLLVDLDALVDIGFDPNAISKADLYQGFEIGIYF